MLGRTILEKYNTIRYFCLFHFLVIGRIIRNWTVNKAVLITQNQEQCYSLWCDFPKWWLWLAEWWCLQKWPHTKPRHLQVGRFGRRGFSDVIKWKILKLGDGYRIIPMAQHNHKELCKKSQKCQSVKIWPWRRGWVLKGHEPTRAQSLRKMDRARKGLFLNPPEEA